MVKTIFKKEFSEIKGIQKKEEILYRLSDDIVDGNSTYGIQVFSICEDNETSESVQNISSSKEMVLDIIKYLYENSVKTENFKDIIFDMYKLSIKS